MNIDFLDDYGDELDTDEKLEDEVDCLVANGNPSKAIEVLKTAEQQSPWKVSIKKELAKAYLISTDEKSAIEIIETIKSQLPTDFEIPVMLSIIYRIFKRDNSIADKYEQEAFQLAYYKDDVYFLICYILCNSGFFTEAYKYVKKALKYNKDDTVIWDYRAFLEYQLGKYYAMEKCLQKELSINPELVHDYNFHIYTGLFLSYYYSGRFEKIFELLQKCSVEYIRDDGGLILMAQILRLYNKDDRANRVLQYLFANKKNEFENLKETIMLGRIAHTVIDVQGDLKSFNFLATYIRQLASSDNPVIRQGIKLLFEDICEYAEYKLRKCVFDNNSPVLRIVIAYALFHSGRINKVIIWLKDAIEKSKDKYTCWFYLNFITDNQKTIEYLIEYFTCNEATRYILGLESLDNDNTNYIKNLSK